jgi:hypothetical protein
LLSHATAKLRATVATRPAVTELARAPQLARLAEVDIAAVFDEYNLDGSD